MLNEDIKNKIETLANDKTNGSITLAKIALDIFTNAVIIYKGNQAYIKSAAEYIIKAKPNMSAISNIITHANQEYALCENVLDLQTAKANILVRIDNATAKSINIAANQIQTKFQNSFKLLTCSFSSTFTKTILKLTDLKCHFEVLAMESKWENYKYGEFVGSFCKKYNISCRILPDSSIAEAVSESDLALTGADTLTSDGGAVNGYPSFELAKACESIIPFFVVAESIKKSRKVLSEIHCDDGFDKIPVDLINQIFSDEGLKF